MTVDAHARSKVEPRCAVLIATHAREDLLEHRALPSIAGQTTTPDRVVIVDDGGVLAEGFRRRVHEKLSACPVDVLDLVPPGGAAAAWNTGLRYLLSQGFDGFVAILDDDDTWDPRHLEANLRTAQTDDFSMVVSGLRICLGGQILLRPLIDEVAPAMFLTGNPGWQGSNTFATLDLLLDAGGFREGLSSLNDRDLALRVLSRPQIRVGFTGQWTATWFADTPGALSKHGSEQKAGGLAAFWRIHQRAMTPDQKREFFQRGEELFGIAEERVRGLSQHFEPADMPGVHGAPLQ